MPKPLAALVLFVLLALGALATFWVLGGGKDDASALAPGSNPSESQAPALEAAAPEQGGSVASAPTRTALEGLGAAANGVGPAIVGQVLDAGGNPVPAAVVVASSTFDFGAFGGRGRRGFDPSALDPQAMLERARAEQRLRNEVLTDAEGRFRIAPRTTSNNVRLQVFGRGFLALERSAQRPTTADVDLGTLALQRAAQVRGRVVDRNNRPVANARIERRSPPSGNGGWDLNDLDVEFPGSDLLANQRDGNAGLSDAEGRFELPHLQSGDFVLRASHPDHPATRSEKLTAVAGQVLDAVILVLEPGATISGRIVGLPSGSRDHFVQAARERRPGGDNAGPAAARDLLGRFEEVSGAVAEMGLPFGERMAKVREDDTFEIRGLRIGTTYRVWLGSLAFAAGQQGAQSETKSALAGATGVELRYDPGILVTFQVVDAETKKPIEALWVDRRLQGGGRGGPMDFLGMFGAGSSGATPPKRYPAGKVTLDGLRPRQGQSLNLSVEAIGFATLQRDNITLPTSGALDLGVLEARPAPTVRVCVLGNDTKQPIGGALVRLQPKREGAGGGGGNPVTLRMGADGAINFGGPRGGGGTGNGHRAVTDAEGRCELNVIAGTNATLSVATDDYAPFESEIALPKERSTEHEVRVLRGGTVIARVLGPDDKPLPKAEVDASEPGGRRSNLSADASGLVTFEHLAPGKHKFRLRDRRNRGDDVNAMVRGMGIELAGAPSGSDEGWLAVDVVDGGRSEIVLRKAPTSTLSGIVRENGIPLADAQVTFQSGPGAAAGGNEGSGEVDLGALFGGGGRGRSVRSGEDGKYALAELPTGPHRLRITHKGRAMPTVIPLDLRLGENLFDVDLDVTILRGTVRDGDGRPVAGASVVAARPQAPQGAAPAFGEARLDFARAAMPDFGGPMGERGATKTDAEGRYEIRGVQPGAKLEVRATLKGYVRGNSATVEPQRGETREALDVTLLRAGTLQVTSGVTAPFSVVKATLLGAGAVPDPSVQPQQQMLRRGAATLEGLRPGTWKIEVLSQGTAQGDPKTVDVVAGKTTNLEL